MVVDTTLNLSTYSSTGVTRRADHDEPFTRSPTRYGSGRWNVYVNDAPEPTRSSPTNQSYDAPLTAPLPTVNRTGSPTTGGDGENT